MTHRPNTPEDPGVGSLLWGAAAALLAVLCCAGPVLIAVGASAGVLGAIGAWLASPWVIGLAVALAAVAVVGLVRRIGSGHSDDDCCAPDRSTADSTPPGTGRDKDR